MKFLINKSILENILINIQPYLEKKDYSQITSHILIKAQNGNLSIDATDFEIGISYSISSANIVDDGVATANGKKLLDIIKILKDGEITIETINDSLYIKQNNSKFKLPVFNASEFPSFPELESKSKFEIDNYKLTQAIKKITPSIDFSNPKFELNGALINIKEGNINFVSTDTKRLSIVTYKNEEGLEDQSLIIPKKAISEIQKLLFDEIEIFYDAQIMIISSKNFKFFTKLINGKFPEYERIIPKDIKYELILDKNKIAQAVKQVSIVSSEIKITMSKSKILFESLNEDNIEAKTAIDVDLELDKEISFGVNSKFITDFLTCIDDNNFRFGYNDTNLPFTLRNEEFIKIIMPLVF